MPAEDMFRVAPRVKQTMEVKQGILPTGDYVSPGFDIILPDKCFPNVIVADPRTLPWPEPYSTRRDIPHNTYMDKRFSVVGGLVTRDEAHILYNTALKFKGKLALEIGCWVGWSTCHLALGGVELDVIDPLLGKQQFYETVTNSLKCAGVWDSVNLIAGSSPNKVEDIAVQLQRKWSLIFIDGNHEGTAPLNDAVVCEKFAESDALILFHDLVHPDVARALNYLKQKGWNTMIYSTQWIVGVAWRGQVEPVRHQPDPKINWSQPAHLQSYSVSNLVNDKAVQTVVTPKITSQPSLGEKSSYTKDFYESISAGSRRSAKEILPLVLELIKPFAPKSVVDVGCGLGTWLAVFKEFGIEDCLGIDGDYVDKTFLQIPPSQFKSLDLKQPLEIERKFDLAISLEVAEHLPDDCAEIFINSLTQLAPIIIFSAAIPFQGGVDHFNEQWPQYWVKYFQKNGYVVIDCLRRKIWNNDKVESWYAQNILIFVKNDCLSRYPGLEREYQNTYLSQLAIVHPKIYLSSLATARNPTSKKHTESVIMPKIDAVEPLLTQMFRYVEEGGNHSLDSNLSKTQTVQTVIPQSSERALSSAVEQTLKPGNEPLVSVVIPCYNQAQFLPESVASVIAQTYENWEIIIVNDGSPDNTSFVAHSLMAAYPNKKIRLIEKANGGLASARNAGIAAANGEYIMPLDADDKLSSNAVACLLEICLKPNQLCVAFGTYQMFGIENRTVVSADLYSPEQIKRYNMLHPSSMYPKSVWNLVGGYKVGMNEQGYEDWELWVNCHRHNISFCGTREVVVHYRRRHGSMIGKAENKHEALLAQIICYNKEFFGAGIVKNAERIVRSLDPVKYLKEIVEQDRQAPGSPLAIEQIRKARKQIAERWISVPNEQLESAYSGDTGKAHFLAIASSIKDEPLTDAEQTFVDEIAAHIARGFKEPNAIQYLLAARLYRYAYQLPLKYENAPIPKWFLDDFLTLLLEAPRYFQERKEAEKYSNYIQQLVDYIHIHIVSNKTSVSWQKVAEVFTKIANFTPLYFTEANWRNISTKRSEIIESFLTYRGHQIDYSFPSRPGSGSKIRLGVLLEDFGPHKDTLATLPAFEYLDRDKFEIILYAIELNGTPLEQYCARRAAALIKLPDELQEQVRKIRAYDLDILLIGTNTTATTNPIALLALHRLARVQLTGASSPVTTGMRHVDYYIAGNLTSSSLSLLQGGSSLQQHYREQLVTVEGSGLCFKYSADTRKPTVKPHRNSWGATDESVVFISGANFYKIIPELREVWAKVIAAVENSILVLYPFGLNWASSYPSLAFYNQMRSLFAEHGLDKSRLVIIKTLPDRADVKECLKLADVYLDSYPYTGAMSLLAPLEVGLPTVVREGNTWRSQRAAAMLRELDLPELIARSEEDYIKLAVALGTNRELRGSHRQLLLQKMQGMPGFLDSRAYSAKMGELFQQLLVRDCSSSWLH